MSKEEIYVDLKNEQIIIALMLVDVDVRSRLSRSLRAEDFVGTRHQRIFTAIRAMLERGLAFTEPTLLQVTTEDIGGIEYLEQLKKLVDLRRDALVNNLEYHIKNLYFGTLKYKLIVSELPQLTDMLSDEAVEPEQIKRELRKLGGLSDSVKGQLHTERGEPLIEAYKVDQNTGFGHRPTGFKILDIGSDKHEDEKLVMGTAPGIVGIIAARPSVGKSMLSTQMARRLASRGISTNICTWEMGKIPTQHLLVAQWIANKRRCGFDYPDITLEDLVYRRYGKHEVISMALEDLFGDGTLGLMKNPFFTFEEPGKKNTEYVNASRMDALENEIANDAAGVWIFDLWERMLISHDPNHIGNALNRMQWMAGYYQKCFIILQHINRKWNNNKGNADLVRPPVMEDIKNAGAYEEVADWICVLHRPGLHTRVPDKSLEVYCRKQRMGKWPWAVGFDFDGKRSDIYGNGYRVDLNEEEEKVESDGGVVF